MNFNLNSKNDRLLKVALPKQNDGKFEFEFVTKIISILMFSE